MTLNQLATRIIEVGPKGAAYDNVATYDTYLDAKLGALEASF